MPSHISDAKCCAAEAARQSVSGLRRDQSLLSKSRDADAVRFKLLRDLQRRLSPKAHDDPFRLFVLANIQHILNRQRFKIEFIGRIVVGRDCFGIAVDHDGLVSLFAKGVNAMNTAIVELDSLSDPVGPPPRMITFFFAERTDSFFFLVRRVMVRRVCFKFCSARVDSFENGSNAELLPQISDSIFIRLPKMCELFVGKSVCFALKRTSAVTRKIYFSLHRVLPPTR